MPCLNKTLKKISGTSETETISGLLKTKKKK